ncbi:MAG: hypothetical protein WDZ59_14850 [Pirellulales bacterium]
MLNGLTVEPDGRPIGNPDADEKAIKRTVGVATSEVLRRLFETGPDALFLGTIGTEISDTAELVSRLDALGDVTIVQDDANGLILDVQIQRRLQGDAELGVDVLGGAVRLEGEITVSGEVTAKLRLGVDARGFYFDADAFAEPEFVIRNLEIDGDVDVVGKVGFLGVTLDAASLEIDPIVAINIDIQDPGTDPLVGDQDGVVRVYELADNPTTMATGAVMGNPAADDMVLNVSLSAQPLVEGLGPLFDLVDTSLQVRFADLTQPNQAQITVASEAGQALVEFLNADIPEIVAGIREITLTFQSFTGVDLLAVEIPLLGKSIGEILSSVPEPLTLNSSSVVTVGELMPDGSTSVVQVTVSGINLLTEGVSQGDLVKLRAADGGTIEGQVASVGDALLTVRIAAGLMQEPDRNDPTIEIARGGGLGDQLAGLIGESASTLVSVGTIQDLLAEIALRIDVDLSQFNLNATGTGVNRVVTLNLPLDIQPWTFQQQLDLSGQIPGMELNAAGMFQFVIDPQFNITLGIRTAPGISPAERVFIVDNDAPEVKLDITAHLDNPVVHASLGPLELTLQERVLPINDGIKIIGSIAVDLDEPVADDGRITLTDLASSLTDVLDIGIDARFDIDGLELKPTGALAGALGTIQVSLDGSGPGHVTSLADLTGLPSAIDIQGLDEFLNFDNLTELALLRVLEQLQQWLDELRGSSVFATDLPLTGKTLGDVIDLGTAFFDTVVTVLDNPRLVAEGLASVDGRLTEDVSLSLSVNDSIDLNFTLLASQTQDNTDLEDLADDVRAALAFSLQNAGLPNALDVGIRQGALTIFAKTDEIKGLAVSTGNSLVGFAKDQIADALGYRSLDEFFDLLAQRLPGPLNPSYDAATNLLTFTVAFDKSLETGAIPLAFGASLGSLAEISTSSELTVTADAAGRLRVGINLSNLTGSFQLTNSTLLSSINGGEGVVITPDTPTPTNDLQITLRNGGHQPGLVFYNARPSAYGHHKCFGVSHRLGRS